MSYLNQNQTHVRHRRGASESIHEINESEQCENRHATISDVGADFEADDGKRFWKRFGLDVGGVPVRFGEDFG